MSHNFLEGKTNELVSESEKSPVISVVIPTLNRAKLLDSSLESLAGQSLPRHLYEVVVVNDGSTDATAEVCERFSSRFNLKYLRIENSGISVAKNHGIRASSGRIVMFFDDDDIADKNLLGEHLATHQKNPHEGVAVLGFTDWAAGLDVTPVMEYATDVGQILFSYKNLLHGQALDFTYFWGGRSSCKRSLLLEHGVFNENFPAIIEDIELGYRLSKFGLKVIFNRKAASSMIRPVTYGDLCRRCERIGRALFLFSRLHADPVVQRYCNAAGAEEKWNDTEPALAENVRRVEKIEAALMSKRRIAGRSPLLRRVGGFRWRVPPFKELGDLYWRTFTAFRVKGMVEQMRLSNVK